MSKKIVDNWITLAKYDLETAKHMLKTKRYLYVAFTCQQSVEKILKAVFVQNKKTTPPYTHNLTKLPHEISAYISFTKEQNSFLTELNYYYISTRYTEDWAKISRNLNHKRAKDFFEKTQILFQWLLKTIK